MADIRWPKYIIVGFIVGSVLWTFIALMLLNAGNATHPDFVANPRHALTNKEGEGGEEGGVGKVTGGDDARDTRPDFVPKPRHDDGEGGEGGKEADGDDARARDEGGEVDDDKRGDGAGDSDGDADDEKKTEITTKEDHWKAPSETEEEDLRLEIIERKKKMVANATPKPGRSSTWLKSVETGVKMKPTTEEEEMEISREMKKIRIFCMVPYRYNMGIETQIRYKSIIDTWGKRCDMLKFMSEKLDDGVVKPDNVDEVLTLKRKFQDRLCGDNKGCKHIWEKVWRSWVHVYDNYIDDYDWFVKIDHDTYFFAENAKRFIVEKGWDADEPHYAGHKLYHRSHEMTAGGCTLYSRAVIKLLVPHYLKMPGGDVPEQGRCEDHYGASEDFSSAICLQDLKIWPEDDLDRFLRDVVIIFYPSAHLKMLRDKVGWFWKNKPDYIKDKLDCCSAYPVGFHNIKTLNHFGLFEQILYGPNQPTDILDVDTEDELTRSYYYGVRAKLRETYKRLADVGYKGWLGWGGGVYEKKGL